MCSTFRGARVSVRLSLAGARHRAHVEAVDSSRASDAHPCNRVLVVDDNEDMLDTMRDVLEMHGSTVQTATSTEEAERLLAIFEPSVIVLDLRLGADRGDEFASHLKGDPRYAGIPIVLMSGDTHSLRRLDGAPADATLSKPFDVQHFYDVLAELCSDPRGAASP